MPNYKPKMHMRYVKTAKGSYISSVSSCGHLMPKALFTEAWSEVTCGNCLRCRPKGERDDN